MGSFGNGLVPGRKIEYISNFGLYFTRMLYIIVAVACVSVVGLLNTIINIYL